MDKDEMLIVRVTPDGIMRTALLEIRKTGGTVLIDFGLNNGMDPVEVYIEKEKRW